MSDGLTLANLYLMPFSVLNDRNIAYTHRKLMYNWFQIVLSKQQWRKN